MDKMGISRLEAPKLSALPRVIKGLFDADDTADYVQEALYAALDYFADRPPSDDEDEDEGHIGLRRASDPSVDKLMCLAFLSDDESSGGWWNTFDEAV